MSKKRRNIIDVRDAILDFNSMGFGAGVIDYAIRIKIDRNMWGFYDWYHTTGTLVQVKGFPKRLNVQCFTPSEVVEAINKFEK